MEYSLFGALFFGGLFLGMGLTLLWQSKEPELWWWVNIQLIIPGLEKFFPEGKILTNGRLGVTMDKQIRKIEKKIKKDTKGEEKELKHLEKEDKKRDKVCDYGKAMMKKKK